MINNIERYIRQLLDQYLVLDSPSLRIGAIILGGLGDALDFWAWLAGCRRMFPKATIVAYTGNELTDTYQLIEKYSEATIALPFKRHLKYFGLISHPLRGSSWLSLVEVEKDKYDIFFDLRPYGCGIYKNSDFFCPEWFEKAYHNILSIETAKLSDLGLSVVALRNLATGMDGSYDDIHFPLDDSIKLETPYITVHHGAQKDMNTKLWQLKYWKELVYWLNGQNYKIYQLGIRGEKVIDGAISLLGKTSLFQTASILKHTAHHIDTEGGLVRLARCGNIKTVCTVLGGVTPKQLFSFPENNNIWLNICTPCYMRVGFWNLSCQWKLQGIEYNHRCMQKLYPENVINSLGGIL